MSDDVNRPPIVHELKTWPIYFALVAGGHKSFEVRRNDRDFQIGDVLLLREWEPGPYPPRGYTGCTLRRRVHWVTGCEGLGLLAEGVVVLELREEEPEERDADRILPQLVALRQAARRVVTCWGDPDGPLIDPDMGEAIDALREAIAKTKPPFPGTS